MCSLLVVAFPTLKNDWLLIKKPPQCMLKLKVEVAKLLNCFEEYYLFACGLGSKTKF